MGFEIKKEEVCKSRGICKENMKKMYEEAKVMLKNLQEEIKKYEDRKRKEAV